MELSYLTYHTLYQNMLHFVILNKRQEIAPNLVTKCHRIIRILTQASWNKFVLPYCKISNFVHLPKLSISLYVYLLWVSFHWVVSNQSPQCVNTYASIYSKLMLFNRFPHTYVTLNNSLSNLLIPSQRLVTMSASLCTQTVLCCLIIQVLNIKSLFPKCLIQSLSLLYTVI